MLISLRSINIAIAVLVTSLCPISASTAPIDQHTNKAKPVVRKMHTVKVRVLIYSGRPDPEFIIPVSKIQSSMKQAKRMKSNTANVIPSRLGYKGILIENPAKAGGLPEFLAVYNGKIEATDKTGKQKTYYVDAKRNLENDLLKEAVKQKAIDESLFKQLKADDQKEHDRDSKE